MTITIFHNPRCSKSRATLALLRERGIEPEIRLYLEDPPDPAELSAILEKLGLKPRELMRKGEAEYRELGNARLFSRRGNGYTTDRRIDRTASP